MNKQSSQHIVELFLVCVLVFGHNGVYCLMVPTSKLTRFEFATK